MKRLIVLALAGSACWGQVSINGVAGQTVALANGDVAPATINITAQDTASTTTSGQSSQSLITGTPTANSVANFVLASIDTIRVMVSGTWTGTLQSEVSIDSGTTWYVVSVHLVGTSVPVSAMTANFGGLANVGGATNFRMRATAAMTGTATVRVTGSINPAAQYVMNPMRITDASGNLGTVKAASTAAGATDPAFVVAVSPNNTIPTQGAGAAGASPTGSPFLTACLGRTTLPTENSSAQTTDVLCDRYGRLYTVAPVTSNASSNGTPITTNTNTQIVGAPGSGNHLRIHRLWAQNFGTVTTVLYWGNGSGVKTIPFQLLAGQPFSMDEEGRWELSTNTGLFLNTQTTGASIEWYVEYEVLVD